MNMAPPEHPPIRPAPPGPALAFHTTEQDAIALGNDCRRRGHCCRMGSGIAREDELPAIAAFLSLSVDALKAKHLDTVTRFNTAHWKLKIKAEDGKPYGPCIFYDAGAKACTIHPAKPLYCKVGICNENGAGLIQWYNVHHFLDPDDPVSIREYALACEAAPPIPGAAPEDLVPKEILSKILDYAELRGEAPLIGIRSKP